MNIFYFLLMLICFQQLMDFNERIFNFSIHWSKFILTKIVLIWYYKLFNWFYLILQSVDILLCDLYLLILLADILQSYLLQQHQYFDYFPVIQFNKYVFFSFGHKPAYFCQILPVTCILLQICLANKDNIIAAYNAKGNIFHVIIHNFLLFLNIFPYR